MISYIDSAKNITEDKLEGFFEGWTNSPSPKTHLKLLKNSDKVVLAIDDKKRKVVGFVTAISDEILSAYIPFLEVLPEYRGKGIGEELMRRMLKKLNGIYMIDTICDEELQAFYEKFGMRKAIGMIIRNYKKRSGI